MMVNVLTGKNGFCWKGRNPMTPDEARRLEALVIWLVLDPGETLRGRPIAGQFVDPAQQHRHILELRSGPSLDLRDHQMRQISVRDAEIEMEFHLGHGLTIFPQRVGSRARMTRRRAAPDKSANKPRRPIPAASACPDRDWRAPPRPPAL